MSWLPKLGHPIRTGEHGQSAFSMGLALDAARGTREPAFVELLEERARAFHRGDRGAPIGYEPSGHDFLSPCLGEADLMRRVLSGPEFAVWLREFLPGIPEDGSGDWLAPAVVSDPRDGKLAHLYGLNLSRAWMLEGIAAALPEVDGRVPALRACAESHARAGLEAFRDPHYATAHWLGTFVVYYATGRGRNDGRQ